MAIKINGNEVKYKILHNGGKLKIAYHRYGETVLWRAEKYIFQNGVLESGVTVNNLSIGTTLYKEIEATNTDDEEKCTCEIYNVDLTDYSKMDIEVNYRAYANYGDAHITCGIDEYSKNRLPDQAFDEDKTITIDISSYTGKHFIGFYLYARNESSEPSWKAWAYLNIKSIRLYD